MCGIAGLVDHENRLSPERLRTLVSAMNETLAHRGPDDSGLWLDPTGSCALAQRRLSIVDLSPQGHQPMVDESGETAITYNGEIYNFRELRKTLQSQGFTFKSDCDTEVLLHLMKDHHAFRLSALRGMFAFAHWDSRTRQLFLARDPFGKKPLYIARGPGWTAFASEMRALEIIENLDRTITPEALGDYFLVQYFHAPQTIYRGVEKLPPGCCMTIDHTGHAKTNPYFDFDAGSAVADVQLADSYKGRIQQLESTLLRAVERRLMSDVPLGAFLSGGVDSALIVALMRRLGVPTRTYSVGFADSPDSEHVAAREIADHLGCDHHEICVRPDAIQLAPMIADALDEPNGDSSCLPTHLLSEFTRQHVTVALSGDGGDEMFGGYGRYFDTLRENDDPNPSAWFSPSAAYLGPRWTIFQESQIADFLGEVPHRTQYLINRWRYMLERKDRPLIHRMRNVDAESYLPGSVLAKVDRMSMQFALEVRCPLLDVEVASFASALSANDCLFRDNSGGYQGKRMLKDILKRDLPDEWVNRKKKGFGLPAGFWNGSALREFAHDLLDAPSTRLRDYVNSGALRNWIATQQDPNFFSIYRMWPMLILELWLRNRPAQNKTLDDRSSITIDAAPPHSQPVHQQNLSQSPCNPESVLLNVGMTKD